MAASIGFASIQRGIRHPVLLAILPHPGAARALVQDRGINFFKLNAGRKVKFNGTIMPLKLPNYVK